MNQCRAIQRFHLQDILVLLQLHPGFQPVLEKFLQVLHLLFQIRLNGGELFFIDSGKGLEVFLTDDVLLIIFIQGSPELLILLLFRLQVNNLFIKRHDIVIAHIQIFYLGDHCHLVKNQFHAALDAIQNQLIQVILQDAVPTALLILVIVGADKVNLCLSLVPVHTPCHLLSAVPAEQKS